jgi:isopentenyl-diphosphate delta-isomerase
MAELADIPVILVDENDNSIGTMEKHEAHRKALLHRAVSVFIFNTSGEWLLQQRAKEKYHSNSLWTNTCCTHPLPGETNIHAAKRRLNEEMGLSCDLTEAFRFIYHEPLDNNLTEHELDHVFIGISDDQPVINMDEVMDYKYMSTGDLKADIAANSQNYTVWFRKIFTQYEEPLLRLLNNDGKSEGK